MHATPPLPPARTGTPWTRHGFRATIPRREFRKLLPKQGRILVSEESEDELDSEGERSKSSQEEIPVRDFNLGRLPYAVRLHAGTVETYEVGHVEKVSLSFDEDGLLESVQKSSWSGCPC